MTSDDAFFQRNGCFQTRANAFLSVFSFVAQTPGGRPLSLSEGSGVVQ